MISTLTDGDSRCHEEDRQPKPNRKQIVNRDTGHFSELERPSNMPGNEQPTQGLIHRLESCSLRRTIAEPSAHLHTHSPIE